MNTTEMKFNGSIKNYLTVLEKKRPYRAGRNHEILSVPGRPGGYLSDIETETLVVPVTVLIEAPSAALLKSYGEDLVKWLNVDEPKELIFGDEPGRTYYAVANGSLIPDERVTFARLDIEFLCPDPYKYGNLRVTQFDAALKDIVNHGAEDVQPIFRATVNAPITNLDIVGENEYMRIGAPAPVDETPVAAKTGILDDDMAVTTNWSTATDIDNGHIAGSLISDGNGFLPETWGPVMDPPGWQGPSVIRGLPEAVQDFEAEFHIEQFGGAKNIGMLEIYLRDAAGNVVGKLGIEDSWRDTETNRVKFQLGNIGSRHSENRTADNPAHWNDFRGVMRITRKGRNFSAYFAKTADDGTHHTRAHLSYYDTAGIYQSPVATIQIAFRKWPNSKDPATDMKVTRSRIWRVNTPANNEVVYFADEGDAIEVNHATGEILLNGEQRLDLKDFGSSFFALKPGSNIVSHSPADLVDLIVEFRERY